MRNLLVAIDHSLEASIALRIACRFGSNVRIHPIYVSPPPGHDLVIGAGWARKSWGKENIQQAQKDVRDLIVAQGQRCPHIEEPIVTTGEPVKTIADHFIQKNYDLLITGAPFRGLEPMALAHRFKEAVRKTSKDLPLLVVLHLNTIKKTLVLTDGGDPAEKALGFLNRMSPLLSEKITLIGLTGKVSHLINTEALNLERGLAILKEKDIDATGHTEKNLGSKGIKTEINQADLLICPILSDACIHRYKLFGENLNSVLFYLSQN